MYIVYVKTQLQKLRKIGLNRTYVLKRFFQLQQLRKIIVSVLKILVSEFSKISECNVECVKNLSSKSLEK